MADSTRIRRIPTAQDISGGGNLRPSGANPGIDVASQYQGAQNLAQGVAQLGEGVAAAGADLTRRQNVSDVSAADAKWLLGSNAIGSSFDNASDWRNFNKRASKDSEKARDDAAALISDPTVRQQWLDQTELKRISLIQAVDDKATTLKHGEQVEALNTSVSDLSKLYTDPNTSDAVRTEAKKQMTASIDLAYKTGAISPVDHGKLLYGATKGADADLAMNRARADLLNPGVDPQMVYNQVQVSTSDAGGQGMIAAAMTANNGQMPALDFSLAKVTAKTLGDAAFPDDPKLASAYLSNPETASKYASATVRMLTDRFNGDMSAVAVALNGGTVMADKWIRSKHDVNVLSPAVEKAVGNTMKAYRPTSTSERVPLRASPNVDIEALDPAVLDRWELVQTQFGEAVNIIPPVTGGEHDKATGSGGSTGLDNRGIELDVSTMPPERRAALIATASSLGFTGIGIYKNTLHLDASGTGVWGPDGKPASVPAWAKDVTARVNSPEGAVLPPTIAPVSDRYAALSFDQRLAVAGEAKAEMKRRAVDLQASIETIAQNAPAAIAATGKYDGAPLPDARAFVQAYQSASEGIQKYQAFKAALDTAQVMFGMRTASAQQIMGQVAAAAPTMSGNGAFLQSKQFDAVSAAAEQTMKARHDDPAQYILQTMPDVAKAYAAAGESKDDPSAYAAALQQMQVAQQKLGITDIQLLPKSMAVAAGHAFNDVTKPIDERIGALSNIVTRTSDTAQQLVLFKQLIQDGGVPEYTQGAMAAMMRNDMAGTQNLMRAVMTDPNKMAGALPGTIKPGDIDSAVQSKIMAEGQIGDIVYGITDGSADSFRRVQADSTLINRDVQLHLIDGSAGGSLDKAIDLTVKDMYGDVQTVVGQNIKISLPKNTDPAPYRQGFAALAPKVRNALSADMQNGMVYVLGKDVDPVTAGMSEIIKYGVDNAVAQVMANGYFINAGNDRYQFLNPYTGAVISGADGNPMIFSKGEVLAAGANAPKSATPPVNPAGTLDRMRQIYGGGYGKGQSPYPK